MDVGLRLCPRKTVPLLAAPLSPPRAMFRFLVARASAALTPAAKMSAAKMSAAMTSAAMKPAAMKPATMTSAAARRSVCVAAGASADALATLRDSAERVWNALMDADWVDTDEKLHALVDDAQQVVQQYRGVYSPHMRADALFERVRLLYVAKEAALVSDAYSEFVEVVVREHEDMLGTFGDNTQIPPHGADQALNMINDYVRLVNSLKPDDKPIKRKIEQELGRKIILVKMLLSADNFSAIMVPVAGDHLVTRTK
ncbi:unnamed protein product [Agarophyton chilense]